MAFPMKEKEAGSISYLSANDSDYPPPYTVNQSFPQTYPPQQQYYDNTPSPFGFDGSHPSRQQYPQRTPSPSGFPNGSNPAYRSSSPAAFPTSQPRIFHLKRDGFTQTKAHIYEADNRTEAYHMKSSYSAEWSSSKPNNVITSAYTGQMVGTINFPMWTRQIELVINGRTVPLEYNAWKDRSYRFMSSIGPLKWAAISTMGASLACTTERGEWLAKFDTKWFSMKGGAQLEIVNQNLPQELVDELVVTGLAMLENDRRNMAAAASAGGVGGTAGAC